MMGNNYDCLKLENQLCFPLYACAKEVVRQYTPHLNELNLTYTQYIAMMVLWEEKKINVKELGEKLYLDSGTLTPLLKKLEQKELVTRKRSTKDERNLIVEITKQGEALKEKAKTVPERVGKCVKIDPSQAEELYKTLYEILDGMKK